MTKLLVRWLLAQPRLMRRWRRCPRPRTAALAPLTQIGGETRHDFGENRPRANPRSPTEVGVTPSAGMALSLAANRPRWRERTRKRRPSRVEAPRRPDADEVAHRLRSRSQARGRAGLVCCVVEVSATNHPQIAARYEPLAVPVARR